MPDLQFKDTWLLINSIYFLKGYDNHFEYYTFFTSHVARECWCSTSLLAVQGARRTLRGSRVVRARCDSSVAHASASRHARLCIVGCCCVLPLSSESPVW